MKQACTRRTARGFSLVEVLVAVAIVAVALAAGSRAGGALLNNAQRLSDVTQAQWCAENRLINMRLAKLFPDVGESNAECTQLGHSYRLIQNVRASFNPNFRIVELAVTTADLTPLVQLAVIMPRY
ncbi:MAG: type II secretion system minor pseudopilin GspI [Vitreoscilla sp.]|nr:type II secretion system minor pseudopilin GspI [Burkholderiales bacterium]MBP6337192.1 type II secretion system minor pseudopilin GspI [Vitreoscilla sp.]MBP6674709.1 type II secretion system minor pseudopilin GspI [Vitreoscilla sp.]